MTPAEQRVALGGRDCHGNNYHVTSLGARESSGATSDAPGLYPADEEGGRDQTHGTARDSFGAIMTIKP
jgi:hypothetical protein